MKKIFALALACVMVLSLAACGGKSGGDLNTVEAGKLHMSTPLFPPMR